MKHRLPILFVAVCLFLSGCASSFKSINPQNVPFGFSENTDGVQFSYAYDVLSLKRNKKYVKKERKQGMRVVAVRITNNSEKALRLNENLKLIVGNNQTVPVDPSIVAQNIKQGTWIYLLYLPLNVTVGATTTNHNGQVETTGGATLPTGPVISLANILIASAANKHFREELQKYNLMDKTIEPGQTVYGLITLYSLTSDPIKFEVKY